MPAGARSVARPHRFGNGYRLRQVSCTDGTGTCWMIQRGRVVLVQHIDSKLEAQRRAVEMFREDVHRDSPGWAEFRQQVRTELRGLDLACFCTAGTPCHADVLLEVANA